MPILDEIDKFLEKQNFLKLTCNRLEKLNNPYKNWIGNENYPHKKFRPDGYFGEFFKILVKEIMKILSKFFQWVKIKRKYFQLIYRARLILKPEKDIKRKVHCSSISLTNVDAINSGKITYWVNKYMKSKILSC